MNITTSAITRFSGLLIEASNFRHHHVAVLVGNYSKYGFKDGVVLAKTDGGRFSDNSEVFVLEENNPQVAEITQRLLNRNLMTNHPKGPRKPLNEDEYEQITAEIRTIYQDSYDRWVAKEPQRFNYHHMFSISPKSRITGNLDPMIDNALSEGSHNRFRIDGGKMRQYGIRNAKLPTGKRFFDLSFQPASKPTLTR